MNLTHTVSWIELAWTLFTVLGCIFTSRMLYRATEDLLYLRVQKVNGFREFSATTTIWVFTTLTLIQFIYVIIGGVAMTIPTNDHVSSGSVAVGGILVVTSFFFDIMAYIINARKGRLVEMLKEDIKHGR